MASDGTDFTAAVAGDAIVSRRLSPLAGREDLDDALAPVRAADVGVVNLETPLDDHEGYPAEHVSGYLSAPPWAADELTWAGFDLFSAANNHAADGWHRGMEATMSALEERNLPYAGLGESLQAARRPTYVDTPAGRVALVAACSTVTPGSNAGRDATALPARPGVAPLRVEARYVVPEEWRDRLAELSDELGLEAIKEWRAEAGIPAPEEGFTLLNADALAFTNADEFHLRFEVGEGFRIERRAVEDDVAALTEQVRRADRQADWVFASVHSHEGQGARINDSSVPAFLEDVAEQCVDAGADAVLGHGAHTLRGIELYDGAPIFYGLGNFAAQIETVERLPPAMYAAMGLDPTADSAADVYDRLDIHEDDQYWESVLPVCRFGEDGVAEVELHPLDLGRDRPRSRRGTPMAPPDEHGEAILDRLADLSEPYGTTIDVEHGTGYVRP